MLGPHDERPPGERQVLAVHPLLELARREDPRGARPGTRRAARGRSRAPVARTTARASTCSNPSGPVTSARLGPAHPVTMERVRMSTPLAVARSTQRRA